MRNKSTLNRCLQRSVFSVAAICGLLSSTFHPALAQGPGVQVIRLHGSQESASAPAALESSPPAQPAQFAPKSLNNGTGGNAFKVFASSAEGASSANASSSKTSLTGGASVGQVELTNVRDILSDVRRAEASATHLFGEVTRHPITGYNYVDAMGPVMFEIPMPAFDMSEVLPARRQWVELDMNEMNSELAYVRADLETIKDAGADLSLPLKERPIFDKDVQESGASIDRAVSNLEQLKKLTVAPPYDNLAIAKLISPLHKDLKEVEKTTKKLIGQIKKSR